jgi:hypothetical protein
MGAKGGDHSLCKHSIALGTSAAGAICVCREISHQLKQFGRLADKQSHCGEESQCACVSIR